MRLPEGQTWESLAALSPAQIRARGLLPAGFLPLPHPDHPTNVLERGSQVQNMSEFQELLDFPPAPKLDLFGRLDPALATEQERRGEAVFFGKGQCATCHPAPFYTDNSMHNLQTERFYEPVTIAGHRTVGDGPIKTSPPYLHDARLLTIEDAVEFVNLVLGTELTAQEKADLAAFLRVL